MRILFATVVNESNSDMEEKKLLNKVTIYVFFLHKNDYNYSWTTDVSWTVLMMS